LHNSGAGDEDHPAEALTALMINAGHEVRYQSTDDPNWETVLSQDCDLVAIAGGDGTVRKALTSLAERPGIPATVLPLGSANNIARALGLSGRPPEELVGVWATAEQKRFRVGEVRTSGTRELFVETVGGGLFAEAIRRAEPLERPDEDKVELGLRVLRQLVTELPAQRWHLRLDGHDRTGHYMAVEAMVIGETGPQIPLAPVADPEDRHLDVVTIGEDDRAALASYLDARLDGSDKPPPGLCVQRCLRADIQPLNGSPVRIDDELREEAVMAAEPLTAQIAQPLQLLIPKSCTGASALT
jgi:diacylglycerol kinase family enzyme